MLKDYDNMDLYLPRAFILVAHLRVYHLPNLGTHFYAVNAVTTCGKKIGTVLLQREQGINYDGNGI